MSKKLTATAEGERRSTRLHPGRATPEITGDFHTPGAIHSDLALKRTCSLDSFKPQIQNPVFEKDTPHSTGSAEQAGPTFIEQLLLQQQVQQAAERQQHADDQRRQDERSRAQDQHFADQLAAQREE
jgi:hypothetical protein